jgi:hypothetical protein
MIPREDLFFVKLCHPCGFPHHFDYDNSSLCVFAFAVRLGPVMTYRTPNQQALAEAIEALYRVKDIPRNT